MKNSLQLISLILLTSLLRANVSDSINLYETIMTNDSLLFNLGFNECDLKWFEEVVSPDFEFYHDKVGFTNSKQDFIDDIKTNICQSKDRVKRKLILESVEINELRKDGQLYGAIQTGFHEFYSVSANKDEHLTSIAKFMHVWILENEIWKLSRVYSYNHQEELTENYNKELLFKNKLETEKWLKQLKVPALGVGFLDKGRIQNITVYGEIYKGKQADSGAIFNVASLAKPVTAVVVLKLVTQGLWDLDTPLEKYFTDPDVSGDSNATKLTTRHVLSHQSGFPNWRYENENTKLTFDFEPGTKYQYSGEGFEYLRKALESHFNKTLNELATELIFVPLKMRDTRFYWHENMDESRFARWHDSDGNEYKFTKNKSSNAADDLLTTVTDYGRFLEHIINGAGLTPDLYNEMLSVQSKVKENQHFGLGWLIDENIGKDAFAITHGGDDIGVHAIVFVIPQTKQGLIIFTNSDNGTETYIETIKYYLGDLGQGIIDVETN